MTGHPPRPGDTMRLLADLPTPYGAYAPGAKVRVVAVEVLVELGLMPGGRRAPKTAWAPLAALWRPDPEPRRSSRSEASRRSHERRRLIEGEASALRVPALVFAQLYHCAPPDAQDMADQALGRAVVDAAIARADQIEELGRTA